jgi:hypothetical protein
MKTERDILIQISILENEVTKLQNEEPTILNIIKIEEIQNQITALNWVISFHILDGYIG